jgi:hypothetical protein
MMLIVVEFEVLTAVDYDAAIFWDMTPCSPYLNRRFGEMSVYCPGGAIFQKMATLN